MDISPSIGLSVQSRRSMLTERLKRAFERAAPALDSEEQDQLADLLLARLAEEENALAELLSLLDAGDEAKWDGVFAASGDKLDRLADNALAEIRAGQLRSTPTGSEILYVTVILDRIRASAAGDSTNCWPSF
jgi:hypothetical protein